MPLCRSLGCGNAYTCSKDLVQFRARLRAESAEARYAFLCNPVFNLESLHGCAGKIPVESRFFDSEKFLQAFYIRTP